MWFKKSKPNISGYLSLVLAKTINYFAILRSISENQKRVSDFNFRQSVKFIVCRPFKRAPNFENRMIIFDFKCSPFGILFLQNWVIAYLLQFWDQMNNYCVILRFVSQSRNHVSDFNIWQRVIITRCRAFQRAAKFENWIFILDSVAI